MRINYNVSAVVANNYLNKSDNKLQASMARLSSGLKIVNAKDKGDLAGDFKWDNLKKRSQRQILTGLRASRRMTSLHMARSIRMNSCWMIKRKR